MYPKTLKYNYFHQIINKMNNNGITNLYIDNLMKKISKSYKGTFSCNNIPSFKEHNFSLISNLSKEKEKGSHLVGIYVLKNKIIYFDSYGIQNYNLYLKKYLENYKKRIIYSKNRYNIFLVHIVDFFVFYLFYV